MEFIKKLVIKPLSQELNTQIQAKIDLKTKPVGALGKLELIAFKIAQVQQTLSPSLNNPTIAVFAGDHGIAKEGLVNPYPQEVTYQMVLNFLNGGAAINVFANQNKLNLKIIDAGVNFSFEKNEKLIDAKVAMGTANYLHNTAMTPEQCETALTNGAKIVTQIFKDNCNVIGFGEMGISNTSSSALIMSSLCNISIEDCVGKGTGANNEQLLLKISTLKKVLKFHKNIDKTNPIEVLITFGGFEIAQMVGGILKAASLGMLILIDGFISTAAMLIAQQINKNCLEYAIFTHHSEEQGHTKMLTYLNTTPLLNIGMRLGEGSGIAVSYPIINAACSFFNKMASFESAAISNKE